MKRVIITSIFVIGLAILSAGSIVAQAPSVAGEWDAVFNTPGGPRPFKLILQVDGEKLTGTAKRSNGDVPITGTIKGSNITFSYTISYNDNNLTLFYTGTVKGDSMSGTVAFNETASDEWSAKRTPPAKPKTD